MSSSLVSDAVTSMYDKNEAEHRTELETFSDQELEEIHDFRINFSEECPAVFARAYNLRRYVAKDILATRQADQSWAIAFRKTEKFVIEMHQSCGVDC